ncbi:MAG TPA: NUMOD3 domain-containing DNA-binding protein [Candidatus Paceibacterota bacterium]|nr:NUMOD3 domain-containing DNA-binding protein [Candidatus Paceibacterota bacterium]
MVRKGEHQTEEAKEKIRKATIGEKNPFFGKHHSKEAREKMSKKSLEQNRIKISINNLPEIRKGKDSPRYGKHHTEETKRRIGLNKKGFKHTKESILKIITNHRKYQTEETKRKISLIHKGKKLSEEHRKKLSISHMGDNHNLGKRYPIELYPNYGLRKIRKNMIIPVKDTSIEIKIQNYLKQLNITFLKHQYLEVEHGYQCDILIPSMNMVIECDGDYWHGNKEVHHNLNEWQLKQIELDKVRTQELIESGFKVLRLWEHDIRVMELNEFKDRLRTLNFVTKKIQHIFKYICYNVL